VDPTRFEHDNLNLGSRGGRNWLLGCIGLMLIAGVGLAVVAGPPRLPSEPPRADSLLTLLNGTSLPVDGLVLLLVDIAWLALAWTALSLLLELALMAAELVARGRAWVRTIRRLSERLSMPLVRRSVAAAFAVQVLSRGVSIASAQSLPPTDPIVLATAYRDAEEHQATTEDGDSASTYLVRPGDTLWSIAERAYGSGTEYRRLVDANVGRPMPNGQVFSAQGVIQPGWRLLAPGATWHLEELDGERWYTVQSGDTLSSIAATVLGDSARWQDLFDLNRGAVSADGLHVLVEANTIWPGLRLHVPAADAQVEDVVEPSVEQAPELEPTATELSVASAPPVVAEAPRAPAPEAASQADASAPGPATQADAPAPEAATQADATVPELSPPPPPPLIRTSHALQPVVLDRADSAAPDPEPSAPSPDPSPAVDAGVPLPATPAAPAITPLPALPLALGGLGLVGVAGLAFGARRLRRLRPLPQQPESDVVVQGGFAEAQLAHDLTRGMHGISIDPPTAVVGQLEQFLAEYNLSGVQVVAVRHGNSSTSLTLRCALPDQPTLLELAASFAERLQAEVEACVSADQDVVLRLARLRKTRLLPTSDSLQSSPFLVPLGVLYDRQTFAATGASLGHVLIVSLPGHGADTILTSLVATLTSRRSPEQLRVWLFASPRSLPAPMFELPHLSRVVDPADEGQLSEAVEHLRAEIDSRAAQRQVGPDLVVAVSELASLGEHAASLALLAGRAADLGVRLAVASANAEDAMQNPLTPCFGTRMVMQMQAEEASLALLGVVDAAFLAGGGRLLVRLDDREPVELYGYHVGAEHLERLVKVMRSAYPASPASPPPSDPPPGSTARGVISDPPDEPEAPQPESAAGSETPLPLKPEDGTTACAEDQDSQPMAVAPIRIFCFGPPRVVCGEQLVWPHGGRDAKPWELLLFLACHPSETVPRDRVIEALWPDDEGMAEDTAHRFRQLRYRLRRQLQQVPDAPSTDGVCMDRNTFQLDPAIVYSDAREFLTLVHEARVNPDPVAPRVIQQLERARELYVGDLLDGPDARRYAWVDERDGSGVTPREHFRRVYQNSCTRLAEAYAGVGELGAAIELYHDLTEMDPADERLFQALFRLRARCGDRQGLEEEERRMRQILHEMSEGTDDVEGQSAEPDGETLEEYHRLLAGLLEREPEQQREPAVV
jgi:DNA-binding SARP family transcriptional activator/LysM repeat protein